MKKLLIIGTLFLMATVYFTGLYTYFIRTEVQEALPLPVGSAEPKIIAIGSFGEVDLIHKGSGQAKIIEVNGKRVLRLENFNVVSGPDLYVYLSESEKPTGDIKSLGSYVDLGLLKATSGNQNYDIPLSASNKHQTAVVWCKRFGVLFTFAVMK